jgi:hypothetical protein
MRMRKSEDLKMKGRMKRKAIIISQYENKESMVISMFTYKAIWLGIDNNKIYNGDV